MKFIINRENLLKPLQQISSLLSHRPILPVLNNLLLQVKNGFLLLTSTDLEIEIIVHITLLSSYKIGSITVPARKFFDICRSLLEKSEITVILESERILIFSGRSRFSLSTLPAKDFPNLDNWKSEIEFILPQLILKRLIEVTQFSMAHQDVRYYLNGMLFETQGKELHTVSTDGHRLSLCSINIDQFLPSYSVIIPRKGIMELLRLLDNSNNLFKLQIGKNNIRAHIRDFIFTSKLIVGNYPDYRCVFPKCPDKILIANCDLLKKAFSRVAILSNQKFKSVRLYISFNQLKIVAQNIEQEKAEEILDVIYDNIEIEISFNVNYILDILNSLKCKNVRFLFTDSISSVQIEDSISKEVIYIVMPIRL